jgi:hypothetical protein
LHHYACKVKNELWFGTVSESHVGRIFLEHKNSSLIMTLTYTRHKLERIQAGFSRSFTFF